MVGKGLQRFPLPLLLLVYLINPTDCSFQIGEYIQAAQRDQFKQTRTHWHDLLGHYCPRFGRDRLVALPLPMPKEFDHGRDDYKVMLAFAGDRFSTHWLTVISKQVEEKPIPYIDVQLTRSGEELVGVKAAVQPLPSQYFTKHRQLVEEFWNRTHWPKHVLVYYHFETENDVDFDRGLYVLFMFGLLSVMLVSINVLRGTKGKLAQFLADVTSDDAESLVRLDAPKVD